MIDDRSNDSEDGKEEDTFDRLQREVKHASQSVLDYIEGGFDHGIINEILKKMMNKMLSHPQTALNMMIINREINKQRRKEKALKKISRQPFFRSKK